MTEAELNKKFQIAFEKASHSKILLPIDTMLKLYAYYKHAKHTEGGYSPSGNSELRNAFKANALFQIKNLSIREAKLKYIEMVDTYITDI